MPALNLTRRMTARNTHESHRVSTPLELLFDLTFVVAISLVAARLAHGIAGGHLVEELGPYLRGGEAGLPTGPRQRVPGREHHCRNRHRRRVPLLARP